MRKRILFPFIGDSVGGSHISTLLLIRSLAGTRFRPLVVLHEEGPLAEHLRREQVPFRLLPIEGYIEPPLKQSRVDAWVERESRHLVRFLRRHWIHIVHANDLRAQTTWAHPARLARSALVWHQRSAGFGDSQVKQRLLRLANRVLAVSAFTRETLPDWVRDDVSVVYSPFDTSAPRPDRAAARRALLEEQGWPDDTAVIGFFGNFSSRKRPEVFVEVAAALCKETQGPLRFPMFGSAGEAEARAVEECAEALGVADRVPLMGFRHPAARWLAACDLILLPSVREPFGRILVEASLAGTPLVVTASGGNPELIREGETGRVVPPDDVSAMAAAAAELLADPTRAASLADRAEAEARQRFSIETHRDAVVAVYDGLLAARARAGVPGPG